MLLFNEQIAQDLLAQIKAGQLKELDLSAYKKRQLLSHLSLKQEFDLGPATIQYMIKLPNGYLACGYNGTDCSKAVYGADIKIWDPKTGECIRTIKNAHNYRVWGLAALPGDLLASTGDANGSESIKIWDLKTGHLLRDLKGHKEASRLATLANGNFASISFNDNDKTIKIWNTSTFTISRSLEGHSTRVMALLPLNNGYLLASDGNCIKIWQPETGHCISTIDLRISSNAIIELPNNLLACAYGRDYERAIHIYDLYGSLKRTLKYTSQNQPNALAILPNDILVSSHSNALETFNFNTGTTLQTINAVPNAIHSLATLDDGRLANVAYNSQLSLWDANYINLVHRDISQLLKALAQNNDNQLTALSLGEIPLDEPSFNQLLAIVSHHPELETLDISDIFLNDEQLLKLHMAQLYNKITVGSRLKIRELIRDQGSSSSAKKKQPPEIPDTFKCVNITLEIMFDPVVAADGFTYEREAITKYIAIRPMSPATNLPLDNLFLMPNNSLRSDIRSFLDKDPAYWDEVYFSKSLANSIITAVASDDLENFKELFAKDNRLLYYPLNEKDQLLLEIVVTAPANEVFTHVMHLIEIAPANIWEKFFAHKPLFAWLSLFGQQGLFDLGALFIRKATENYSLTFTAESLALAAIKLDDRGLLKIALHDFGDIDTPLAGKNTLLHIAAAQGKNGIVEELMGQGADISLLNDDGKKPAHLARDNGHKSTKALLDEKKLAPFLGKYFGQGSASSSSDTAAANQALIQQLMEKNAVLEAQYAQLMQLVLQQSEANELLRQKLQLSKEVDNSVSSSSSVFSLSPTPQ